MSRQRVVPDSLIVHRATSATAGGAAVGGGVTVTVISLLCEACGDEDPATRKFACFAGMFIDTFTFLLFLW